MPPYINICGRIIGGYAICAMIGIFIAVFVSTKLLKPYVEDIILCVLVLAGGVIIGGHLLYAITNAEKIVHLTGKLTKSISAHEAISFSDIISSLGEIFGGMVYYGGFIGAASAFFIYIKRKRAPFVEPISDVFALCVPLFHTFGRIGCFLGGCCYGIESNIGFTAHDSAVPELNGVKRFPVALLESLFNIILFFILLYLFKKKYASGRIIFLYMMIYPVGRFFIEFLRGDEVRGFLFGLSTSQIISIALLLLGIFMYIRKGKVKKEDCPFDHTA